jgi:TPR repeat protein
MRAIKLIVAVMIFHGCSDHKDLSEKQIKKYKSKVIENNNRSAYILLGEYYYNQDNYSELLSYSLIMSYKHNDKEMIHNVYMDLLSIFTNKKFCTTQDFKLLSDNQKKLALFFLNDGAKQDQIGCINELEKLYRNGWGVEKNIIKADSLKKHLDRF